MVCSFANEANLRQKAPEFSHLPKKKSNNCYPEADSMEVIQKIESRVSCIDQQD